MDTWPLPYLNLAAITQQNRITYFRTSNFEISVKYIRSKNFDTSRFLPDSHPSWRSPPKHLISKQSFLRVYSRNTPWLWQFLSEKNTKKTPDPKSSGCHDLIRLFVPLCMHKLTSEPRSAAIWEGGLQLILLTHTLRHRLGLWLDLW